MAQSDPRQTWKTTAGQLREQTVEFVRFTEENALRAVSAWSEGVRGATPAFAALLPRQTQVLPTVLEAVDGAYDLATELLQAQHEFAKQFVEALTPALEAAERVGDRATRAAKQASAA